VELAVDIRYSKHTAASVELGRRMLDPAFAERAEVALGNTDVLRRTAQFLTCGDAGLAARFRRWARLERQAVSLSTQECRLVPGLLRSEAYARAVLDGTIPFADGPVLRNSSGSRTATAVARATTASRPSSLCTYGTPRMWPAPLRRRPRGLRSIRAVCVRTLKERPRRVRTPQVSVTSARVLAASLLPADPPARREQEGDVTDHRLEGPGENGDPVPRDLPDQQAGEGEDPWEGAPARRAAEDADDGDANGGDGGDADDTTSPEDAPTPDEPTA
jgi:hypothetical protein